MTWLRAAGGIAGAVAVYFLPALTGGSAVAYSTCATIAIFAVMAYGTDLVLSYLGEVSLGHTIFWAGGGYVTALLATRLGWNAWLTALATIVFGSSNPIVSSIARRSAMAIRLCAPRLIARRTAM